MAALIETQVRLHLSTTESLVTVLACLGRCSASLEGGDIQDISYVFGYVSRELENHFELLHEVLNKQVLPLVADVKSVSFA